MKDYKQTINIEGGTHTLILSPQPWGVAVIKHFCINGVDFHKTNVKKYNEKFPTFESWVKFYEFKLKQIAIKP